MVQMETVKGIYLGDRGEDFKRLITSLLKKGNLKQKYIDLLTTPENMKSMEQRSLLNWLMKLITIKYMNSLVI